MSPPRRSCARVDTGIRHARIRPPVPRAPAALRFSANGCPICIRRQSSPPATTHSDHRRGMQQ